jgi:hypothetical protein
MISHWAASSSISNKRIAQLQHARIEPVTTFDYDSGGGLRQFQADGQIADICTRLACMDQIAAGSEGSSSVCTAHTVVSIQAGDRQTSACLAVHERTSIVRYTVRPIRAGSEKHHIGLAGQQSGRGQRQMLISAAPPWIRRKLHGRLTTPDANLRSVQVQLVRKSNRKSCGVVVKPIGRPTYVEAQFLGGRAYTLNREIERRNDRSFDAVGVSWRRTQHA